MSGEAFPGYGCVLQLGDGGSPELFNTIPGIADSGGPDSQFDLIDVTSQSSPNGRRQYIVGLGDEGEFSLDVNYLPQDPIQKALVNAHRNRTPVNMQFVMSDTDNTTLKFEALITKFGTSSPLDGKLGSSMTCKINGEIEQTPA